MKFENHGTGEVVLGLGPPTLRSGVPVKAGIPAGLFGEGPHETLGSTDSIQGRWLRDDNRVRPCHLARSWPLRGTRPRHCLWDYLCPVASVNASLSAFHHASASGSWLSPS